MYEQLINNNVLDGHASEDEPKVAAYRRNSDKTVTSHIRLLPIVKRKGVGFDESDREEIEDHLSQFVHRVILISLSSFFWSGPSHLTPLRS